MIRRLSILAVLFGAGCGGAGGSHAALPASPASQASNAPQSSGRTAPASISILIPPAPTAATLRRAIKYVSPATQSITFTPAGGTPIVVALTANTPGCTATGGGLQCTVNAALPIGANEAFFVATYANAAGTGTPLSVQSVSATIVAGQANPIALSLGGVTSSVAISAPASPIPAVAATSIPVTITAKDASGNTIVGAGAFSDASGNPITISFTNSDTSGATAVSPTTLSSPGPVNFVYDNFYQPTGTTLTATATGIPGSQTASVTFALKPIAATFSNAGTLQLQFGARAGAQSRARGLAHRTGGRRTPQCCGGSATPVTLFALLPTGSTTTPYSLGTHTTQSSGYAEMIPYYLPVGMATAPSGHLYFTEQATQYGLFDAGTTPAMPAASTIISGASVQRLGPIALGPGGKLYAGVTGGFEQIEPTTGALIGNPIVVPNTFNQTIPNAIAVGKDGSVYIEAFQTSDGLDDVLVFSPGTSGFSFSHSFWTGNSHYASDAIYGLAVDASNNVYVSSDYNGTLDVVPASSSGNVLPSMVYSCDNSIDDGLNVVVDRAGNIVWDVWSYLLIFAPNSGTVPPGGTDPTQPYYPGTDTAPLQTLTGTAGASFGTLTFGPGS